MPPKVNKINIWKSYDWFIMQYIITPQWEPLDCLLSVYFHKLSGFETRHNACDQISVCQRQRQWQNYQHYWLCQPWGAMFLLKYNRNKLVLQYPDECVTTSLWILPRPPSCIQTSGLQIHRLCTDSTSLSMISELTLIYWSTHSKPFNLMFILLSIPVVI